MKLSNAQLTGRDVHFDPRRAINVYSKVVLQTRCYTDGHLDKPRPFKQARSVARFRNVLQLPQTSTRSVYRHVAHTLTGDTTKSPEPILRSSHPLKWGTKKPAQGTTLIANSGHSSRESLASLIFHRASFHSLSLGFLVQIGPLLCPASNSHAAGSVTLRVVVCMNSFCLGSPITAACYNLPIQIISLPSLATCAWQALSIRPSAFSVESAPLRPVKTE